MTRKKEPAPSYFPQGTTYLEISRERFVPLPQQKSDPLLNVILALDSINIAVASAIQWSHCAPKTRKDVQEIRYRLLELQDLALDTVSAAEEAWQAKKSTKVTRKRK